MMKTWLLLISLIAINSALNTAQANTMTQTLPDIKVFQGLIDDLHIRFPNNSTNPLIVVSSSEQRLFLIQDNKVIESHRISTATAGLGNLSGSNKTPLGVHQVSEKFGKGAKTGTIFKARMNTHRVAKILRNPNEKSASDNVTSRILWLSGLEKGINKGGKVDSKARFIYIHGTDEEGRLGKPASHGCIRMTNQAVIELFDRVPVGTIVDIIE